MWAQNRIIDMWTQNRIIDMGTQNRITDYVNTKHIYWCVNFKELLPSIEITTLCHVNQLSLHYVLLYVILVTMYSYTDYMVWIISHIQDLTFCLYGRHF